MTEPFDKARLIPVHMRVHVAAGEPPLYRVTRPDYDRLPLNTFLVEAVTGTMGRVPRMLIRVVKPRSAEPYQTSKVTRMHRLLYVCWQDGRAVRMLRDARVGVYRHVVMPGEEGFDLLDAFKIACDTRRAGSDGKSLPTMTPTLLYRALGLDVDLISEAPSITG